MHAHRLRLLCPLLLLLAFTSGCATRRTAGGGRETTVLGGLVTVGSKSYTPPTPTTVDVDTTQIAGNGAPSGTKVSVLWGALTLHDY